jgi:hypothetical protein
MAYGGNANDFNELPMPRLLTPAGARGGQGEAARGETG